MSSTVVTIRGMATEECLRTVCNAIQDLPSIYHLDLSLECGVATIEHGPMVSPDDILQAIVDAGFAVD